MSLVELQQSLGKVLWGPEGLHCLSSSEHWTEFLNSSQTPSLQGFKREQLALYESLLKNTVEETLSSLFPFCKFLLATQWSELVEQYRRAYPNFSYQLYHCAKYFPDFIDAQSKLGLQFPFLAELARYEWLEVEVENAPLHRLPANFTEGLPRSEESLVGFMPVWNAAADLRSWQAPIPSIIDILTEQDTCSLEEKMEQIQGLMTAQPKHYFIYRDPKTDRARFFELNALTVKLIHLSAEYAISYSALFAQLKVSTPELSNIPLNSLIGQGMRLLQNCHEANILLGSTTCLEGQS